MQCCIGQELLLRCLSGVGVLLVDGAGVTNNIPGVVVLLMGGAGVTGSVQPCRIAVHAVLYRTLKCIPGVVVMLVGGAGVTGYTPGRGELLVGGAGVAGLVHAALARLPAVHAGLYRTACLGAYQV